MPLHDFRRQIGADNQPSLNDIGECASRYDVSLIAATLRWLEYTTRRAVLVVSRDGFIKWARSSKRALRTGAFFRTRNAPPIPLPLGSLAAHTNASSGNNLSSECGPEVWFNEHTTEQVLQSDRYDFSISLVHLNNHHPPRDFYDKSLTSDAFDYFMSRKRGSFGAS